MDMQTVVLLMYKHSFLWQNNITAGYKSRPNGHAPTKDKEELQSFLSILNYLGKFSSINAEVCEPLCKLTAVKADWT